MDIPRVQTGFSRSEADDIVAEAARGYFKGCRARIDSFVERNFSVAGAARLHTRAVGWDLLKAPGQRRPFGPADRTEARRRCRPDIRGAEDCRDAG